MAEETVTQIAPKVELPKRKKKKSGRHTETQQKNKIMFDQNAILIKPQVDASDKEIHMRNQFGHTSKNLLNFIQ